MNKAKARYLQETNAKLVEHMQKLANLYTKCPFVILDSDKMTEEQRMFRCYLQGIEVAIRFIDREINESTIHPKRLK